MDKNDILKVALSLLNLATKSQTNSSSSAEEFVEDEPTVEEVDTADLENNSKSG